MEVEYKWRIGVDRDDGEVRFSMLLGSTINPLLSQSFFHSRYLILAIFRYLETCRNLCRYLTPFISRRGPLTYGLRLPLRDPPLSRYRLHEYLVVCFHFTLSAFDRWDCHLQRADDTIL